MPEPSEEFEQLTPADAQAASPSSSGRAARFGERIDDLRVELQPRGVGGVLDLGLDLIRNRFAACIGIATLIWLPMRLISMLTAPNAKRIVLGEPDALFQFYAQASVGVGVKWLAQMLVAAFTARLLFATITGSEATVSSAMRATIARLPGLIALGFIGILLMGASLAACCVPFIPMVWLLTPLAYVYVLEDADVGLALRRSFDLTCGKLFSWPSFYAFWRWAGITTVTSWLVLPFSGLGELGDSVDVRDWVLAHVPMSALAFQTLSVCVGALFMGVATAIQAGVFTAYYLDCRVRRDGLDLRTWLDRVRGSTGPSGGSAIP